MLPLASRRLPLLMPRPRRAFSPFDLVDSTTYAWKSNDPTSLTVDGSGLVSQQRDITGNGCHKNQATDAAKPLNTGFINGVPALDCRPDKHMTPAFSPFPAAGPCEVFSVVWSDRASTADNCYILARPSSSSLNRNILVAKAQFGATALLGSAVSRGNGTMRHTLIQHAYTDGTTGTITQYLYIDRRLLTGTSSCTGVGGTAWSAFGATNGTISLNGFYGEEWVFNRTLTPTQRANMLAYLESEWRALTPVRRYNIVGIFGDSNARGAWGPVNRVEDLTDPRIAMLERTYVASTGAVVEGVPGPLMLAEHPLSNRWRDTASPPPEDAVGPGLAYAKALLADLPSDEGVLLVPCAQGATYAEPTTPLSPDITWSPNPGGGRSNVAYTDAVARMNYARSLGHRLHSGYLNICSNDATVTGMSQATAAANIDAIVNGLRSSISGAGDLPFVVGQIGRFLDPGTYPSATNINAAIADTPNRLAHTAYLSSLGYTDGGDGLHFDAASQRAIGAAAYAAFKTIT